MKKLLLIAVVVALALTLVPLAAAGASHAGWKHGKAKFNLVGTVKVVTGATETTPGMVTIKVKAGTKTVRAFIKTEIAMTVAADAKIRLLTDEGTVTIALADVPVGAKVKARGVIDRTNPANPVFTIKNLKVHPLP